MSTDTKTNQEKEPDNDDEDSVKTDESMTDSDEDSDYIDPWGYTRVNISHDDLFVPRSPLGNPTREMQQGLDRNVKKRYKFLKNFYKENDHKLNELENMRSFLMDVLVENLPDMMYGIENPRMIGEGIKFVITNLKDRFEKYKLTVFEEDERQLSNEEIMGKIKHHRKKIMSIFNWYATEMEKINEENFNLKEQNSKLAAHIHSLQPNEEDMNHPGAYTAEQLQKFLKMRWREYTGLNEIYYQAKNQNSQLWSNMVQLRKDLTACHEDKQILTTQLAQTLDLKKMFQEAVKSVLQKSEDSESKPSKDSCDEIVEKWTQAMQETFTENGNRLHELVTKIDQIRLNLGEKEKEAIEFKEKFEEIDQQIKLLSQSLYMKKVNKDQLEAVITYISRRIKGDEKYSVDLRKLYEKYKELHEEYMKSLGTTRESMNLFEEQPTSSPAKGSSEPGTSDSIPPSRTIPDWLIANPPRSSSQADSSRLHKSYESPIIKPRYIDYNTPTPSSQAGSYRSHKSYESPIIKPRYIDHDTPTPSSQKGSPRSHKSYESPIIKPNYIDPEAPSPSSQSGSSRLHKSYESPIIKSKYIDPETPSPSSQANSSKLHESYESPIIKAKYIDYDTPTPSSREPANGFDESTAHGSYESPIIKPKYIDPNTPTPSSLSPIIKGRGFVDYDTPSTGSSSWKERQSSKESSNCFVKTILLTSPGRKDPIKVDIEVDPKPLTKTNSGEHFVCDISINMQDIGKRMKREITTPFRRRRNIRTNRESPPPLTVSKSRRPHGIFSPKSAFKRQMVAKRNLFGKGYQSPESPWGSGRYHNIGEYNITGEYSPEPILDDDSFDWNKSDELE